MAPKTGNIKDALDKRICIPSPQLANKAKNDIKNNDNLYFTTNNYLNCLSLSIKCL